MEYKTRDEVPVKYTWDLSNRFKNTDEWNKYYEEVLEGIKEIEKFKGKVMSSAGCLYELLEKYFHYDTEVDRLYCYIMLRLDENLSNQEFISLESKSRQLILTFSNLTAFIKTEILEFDVDKLDDFINNYKPLEKYRYYLKDLLRLKFHILDEATEKVISNLSNGYNSLDYISSNLLNSEIDYGTIEDENGNVIRLISNNIRKLMKSSNEDIRKQVYFQTNKARKQFENTFGVNLTTYMDFQHNLSKVRNYKNLIEASFFESNIPYKVNQVLYKVVNKRLDSLQKYFKKLAHFLGKDELKEYDKMANPFKFDREYDVEEAKKMIREATSILGDEYTKIIDEAFEDRWIDFYSYKGKNSGGYCLTNYKDKPVLLINYQNSLEDVGTLVHELGHAVNGYFLQNNNYAHNSMLDHMLMEVASLTNEVIWTNYLINNSSDKKEKISCIYRLLDTIYNNLFDACLEGELENIVYSKLDEGEGISTRDLCEIIQDLKTKYYGDSVKLDEYSSISWISRSHYFVPFYLYKYAISICIAIFIGTKIVSGDEHMKEKYLEFLKIGNNDTPINLLKKIDIDLLDEKIYNSAIDYFDSLLVNLEKLVGECYEEGLL